MRRLRFAALAFFCLALPSVVPGQELDGPAEGKARVYVFQIPPPPNPARGPYPVFTVQLFDGHSYVGFVGPSQYYGFDIDPGTHVLWAKTLPNDWWQGAQKWFLRAKVKAGRTYYVHLLVTYGMARPTLIGAGPTRTRGEKTLKKINKRLAKHAFVVPEPATAEYIEAMQEELGPMIKTVMAKWDATWSNESRWGVLHESDCVKCVPCSNCPREVARVRGKFVTISWPLEFTETSGVPDKVEAECWLPVELAISIKKYAKKLEVGLAEQGLTAREADYLLFRGFLLAEQVSDSTEGWVLHMEIVNVLGLGDGIWSEPESVTVQGKLTENGEVIGTFIASRATGSTRATCAMLEHCMEGIAKDIAKWLTNPTMDAKLGTA